MYICKFGDDHELQILTFYGHFQLLTQTGQEVTNTTPIVCHHIAIYNTRHTRTQLMNRQLSPGTIHNVRTIISIYNTCHPHDVWTITHTLQTQYNSLGTFSVRRLYVAHKKLLLRILYLEDHCHSKKGSNSSAFYRTVADRFKIHNLCK
jgi:hypothetical protein